MSTIYLYQTTGHFAPAPVKTRKGEAKRPVGFAPLDSDGEKRTAVLRHTLTAETFAAWMTEPDAEKRAGMLVAADANEQAANVSPTAEQLPLIAELYGTREAMADALAAGFLAVPVISRAKSAGTSGKTRAEREVERADAALALLFPEPVEPVEGEAGEPAVTEPTPEVTPESVTEAPAKGRK